MPFLKHLVSAFSIPIEWVRTDNGPEFTKRFSNGAKEYNQTIFKKEFIRWGVDICLTNLQLRKEIHKTAYDLSENFPEKSSIEAPPAEEIDHAEKLVNLIEDHVEDREDKTKICIIESPN